MTKQQFKKRWEKDSTGDGITFDDIADCAIAWGISNKPFTRSMVRIRYLVLKAANVKDAELYNPEKD